MKYKRILPHICSLLVLTGAMNAGMTDSIYAEETDALTPGIYQLCAAEDKSFSLDQAWCEERQSVTGDIQMYHNLDIHQQKFYIEALPQEGYRISSLATGQVLSLSNATSDREGVQEISFETMSHEQSGDTPEETIWYTEHMAGNIYYLRSSEGLYLTRAEDSVYNGEKVEAAAYTGKKNQRWVMEQAWIGSEVHSDTDAVNPYAEYGRSEDLQIVLSFGEEEETLSAERLLSWVIEDTHEVELDEEALKAYVDQLAEKYNTVGNPRNFRTSYGKVITLYKGDFGWKMDVSSTLSNIKDVLHETGQVRVDPVWTTTGGSLDGMNDIGDSYVEVDLLNQKVWLYVDGEQLLETACVSGTYGTDRQTPGGVYDINGMQSPATLRGPGYASPVSYWMPFNGGIGLHDATWRSEFGGDIFRTNGSHGCINLPLDAAELIYNTVHIGFPVVCYS